MTTVRLPDAAVTAGEIEYPESDGQPMSETELHWDETVDLVLMLQWHFRDRAEVHVGGDLFVYYQEGDPTKVFSPDVFVAFGVGKEQLRTYKIWELGPAPAVVIEISSRQTWREDVGHKKALCAQLGVAEYYLYDPEQDYLDPALQGFRLERGTYRAIEADDDGGLTSEALGLRLRLEDGRVQLYDLRTGKRILRSIEDREMRLQAEADGLEDRARRVEMEARAAAERAQREAAEARAAAERARREAAEGELDRLRAEIERLQGGSSA